MAFKFNGGRGAIVCDNCSTIVWQDIAPSKDENGDIVQFDGYCSDCADEVSVGLPKWPAFIVVGENVTPQQAMEIIIRTGDMWFGTNDKDWERQLYKAAGIQIETESNYLRPVWVSVQRARDKYGVLDLEYLKNDQVASCYVGGPKGWCDWHGIIGCNSFNIGKWPGSHDVLNEWKLIAETFPFLTLHCQLLSGEQCEEGIYPLVEYFVREGKVMIRKAEEDSLIDFPQKLGQQEMIERFTNPHAERGCSIDTFKRALALCDNG